MNSEDGSGKQRHIIHVILKTPAFCGPNTWVPACHEGVAIFGSSCTGSAVDGAPAHFIIIICLADSIEAVSFESVPIVVFINISC